MPKTQSRAEAGGPAASRDPPLTPPASGRGDDAEAGASNLLLPRLRGRPGGGQRPRNPARPRHAERPSPGSSRKREGR